MADAVKERASDAEMLPRFFRALVDVGALDENETRRLTDGDISTGVGMLTALAKLNMIHSAADMSASDEVSWLPSWLPSVDTTAYDPGKYAVSSNNQELFDLLKNRVTDDTTHVGELYLVKGNPGVGRTHLLSTLAACASRKHHLLNVMDLDVEMERAIRRRERSEFYRWLLAADVLLLDDIQYARQNNSLQKELRHLIVSNQSRGGVVVATCQCKGKKADLFDVDLRALIESGIELRLRLPDVNGRLDVLKRHFGDGEIPAEAAQYLADNVDESMRQLMGAAGQLINLSRQTATPITKDMARAVLPLPQDLTHVTSLPPNASNMLSNAGIESESGDRARFFRDILSTAENEEEQALALQLALGQRLRELKEQDHTDAYVSKLEKALSLLRDGMLEEAIKCIGT